ncbi:SusC/RagA family TonB-linked outer membrane protein [Sphingobacteriales bacterium UPWRP_1]|nr:hypothetical protein B6N25_14595 [Sphingobacteriales bacterium TSM_CSS]PSJ78928.1 SusC/RagA family TonB-linked outer membrane protein [Sphingobacteriales bacterium UPWRP_1]
MKKIFLLLLFVTVAAGQAFAQRTITGTVTDATSGEPVVGVNVSAKGTTVGTVTDLDGKYSLGVPKSANAVVFSFVGYKTQTIALDGASNILDVALEEDVLNLDNVVVTAVGVTRDKKALGYSVQEVGGDKIGQARETNVVSALAGKVAGLYVNNSSGTAGASAFVRIRGTNTIQGDNQPLFVIDGVPIDNSQNYTGNPDNGEQNNLVAGVAHSNRAIDIPQSDIASITVLKGAAATALYGSQAGNGAIIITTKRGTKKAGKGMNVEFSTGYDVTSYNKMIPLQTLYAQGNNGVYQGPASGQSRSWGPLLSDLVYNPEIPNPFDKNGSIVSKSAYPNGKPVTAYNNIDDFFQNGSNWTNALALSGGNDLGTFRLSMGYDKSNGIVPNNTFAKGNIGINGDMQVSSKFKVSAGATYINSGGTRIEQGSNTSGVMLGLTRTPPSFDNSNGLGEDAVDDESSYLFPSGAQRNYRGGGGYDNPFWTVNRNPLKDRVNRLIGNIGLTYTFTDWLNLSYKLGNDFYSDRRKQFFAIGSRTAALGRVIEDQYFNSKFNADLILRADKQITDDLRIGGLIGHNMRSTRGQRLYNQGDNLTIPGFYHLSNASTITTRESISRSRDMAVYATLEADFMRAFYLTLTGRNEWTTTLPEGGNSFFYPSASLGIVFTELAGLSDNKFFPYGKIRASWAKVGLGSPFLYATANYYTSSIASDGWTDGVAFPYAGLSGFESSDVLGDPNLKPESRTEFEIGLETKFFNGRLGFDATYYSGESVDLIFPVPVARSSGYSSIVTNSGRMTNKGWEIVLSATPVRTGSGFNWDVEYVFTRNRNVVEELAEGVPTIILGGFEGANIRAVAGEPYGSMYGTGFYYDAEGNRVIGSDGYPLADPDERSFGTYQPDWTMGLRNTLSFKGVSLGCLFDFRKGGIMWNGTKGALYYFGTHKDTEARDQVVVFDGVKATYGADGLPVLDANGIPVTSGPNDLAVPYDQNWLSNGNGNGFVGNNTEDFIENTDWVRLREVTLSYRLPYDLLKKSPFGAIDVTLTGRNLWLTTPYTGVDPETSLTGATNAQGLDYFNMPNTKSIGVGLRITL